MIKQKYVVNYFCSSRGISPVLNFLEKLPIIQRSKASHIIVILQEYGPFVRPPYSKKITSNLWELRTSGNNPIRILYTKHNYTYYLLHAFQKKSNKTPKKEIIVALDRMKEIYNI